MILHKNKDAFKELINVTGQHISLPEIYVEKDYFVTLALKQLALSDYRKHGVFKGGTALSKAHKLINRFSEDVDIGVVDVTGKATGSRSNLKNVRKVVVRPEVLIEDVKDSRRLMGAKFCRMVYQYPRLVQIGDFGQASSKLLIEVSCFTPSVPFEEMKIQSYIGEYLEVNGQKDILSEFKLNSFSLYVLSLERTFVDKLLVLIRTSSLEKERRIFELKSKVRHIYDLNILLKQGRIKKFLSNDSVAIERDCHDFLLTALQDEYEGLKEKTDYPKKWVDTKFSDTWLFKNVTESWNILKWEYKNIFSHMVYGPLPENVEIINSLEQIRKFLISFDLKRELDGIKFLS